MTYVPLHVHSEYSLLDGLSQTTQISSRLNDIETEVCALTDHGTVSGAVDFCKTLSSASQRPILGCELYICMQDAKDQSQDNRPCASGCSCQELARLERASQARVAIKQNRSILL